MPLTDFYKYSIKDITPDKISAVITINKNHKIFKGHFPDYPVVPGVVQTLMITEILSQYLKANLSIESSKSIKFLRMINPEITNQITAIIGYSVSEGKVNIKATLQNEEHIFLKFTCICCERE